MQSKAAAMDAAIEYEDAVLGTARQEPGMDGRTLLDELIEACAALKADYERVQDLCRRIADIDDAHVEVATFQGDSDERQITCETCAHRDESGVCCGDEAPADCQYRKVGAGHPACGAYERTQTKRQTMATVSRTGKRPRVTCAVCEKEFALGVEGRPRPHDADGRTFQGKGADRDRPCPGNDQRGEPVLSK